MSRAKPVAVVGRVRVLAPTGTDAYYRFTWTRPDGTQGRTRGCKTLEDAVEKAGTIDDVETRAADPLSTTTLGDVAALYLASPIGRHQKTGRDWTHSQHTQVAQKLTRMLRGFDTVCVLDYDRQLADRIRAQAGTPNGVRQNTTILRGLVRWGAARNVFTPTQAELLPVRCLPVEPSLKGTPAPRRREAVRAVGTSERYIAEEDAPSVEQVRRMGDELELRLPGRGKLAAELAADSGPRKAEMLQLTAHDVVRGTTPFIRIDWQFDDHATQASGKPRRVRPKGGKTRVTGAAVTSLTGFPLRSALLARVDDALAEQRAGHNPEALLFPTDTGRAFWSTEFDSDHFVPAALAAGWSAQRWLETYSAWDDELDRFVEKTRPRMHLVHTWHSLRHRFARLCVDHRRLSPGELMAAGGWENLATVENRYYRSGIEHQESALAKF